MGALPSSGDGVASSDMNGPIRLGAMIDQRVKSDSKTAKFAGDLEWAQSKPHDAASVRRNTMPQS
jgi:hypothetical protein